MESHQALNEMFAQLCNPSVPVVENPLRDGLSKHIKDLNEVHKVTGRMSKGPWYAPYTSRGRDYSSYMAAVMEMCLFRAQQLTSQAVLHVQAHNEPANGQELEGQGGEELGEASK